MVFNLFHSAKIERIYTNSRGANIGSIRFPPRLIGCDALVLLVVFIVLPCLFLIQRSRFLTRIAFEPILGALIDSYWTSFLDLSLTDRELFVACSLAVTEQFHYLCKILAGICPIHKEQRCL